MKIKVDYNFMEFFPESDQEWFEVGRICSNLGHNPKKNSRHLEPTVDKIQIPLKDALHMLSDGKILNEKEF